MPVHVCREIPVLAQRGDAPLADREPLGGFLLSEQRFCASDDHTKSIQNHSEIGMVLYTAIFEKID
jgi:hypothetical protein